MFPVSTAPSNIRAAVAALAAAALMTACGDSSPTSPGPPTAPPPAAIAAGTTLTVTSGETDQPIQGASVTVAGGSTAGTFSRTFTTDGAGKLTLDRPVYLSPPPDLEVRAPGFLDRLTYLRQNETVISLWPRASSSGLDEEFSSTLVYSASTCPAQNSATSILRRIPSATSEIRVAFDATLQDVRAQAAHGQAMTRLNAAASDSVRYTLSPDATGENVFMATIDPNHATCTAGPEPLRAATSLNTRNGEIVGGRLTYCTVDAARSVSLVLHELGHSAGLYHSASQQDVMYCTSGRPPDLSIRERLALRLMRQRRPGNRWPDNDRASVAPLALSETVTIGCGEFIR